MKRVLIIGGPGSGKSTLAKRLHAATGLPLFHLDKLYWRPGWNTTPKDEWRLLVTRLCASEEWIMDGGYDSTFDIRMPRADWILWLNLPRYAALPRILKRTLLSLGRIRPDLAPGCPERIDWTFLKWAWTWEREHAAKYRLALESFGSHATVRLFASSREANQFLLGLSL
jgi:adenylate kinase family enzyme